MSLPAGKLISAEPAIQPNGGPGPLAFGVMFACLVAPHSVLVLFYGLTGSSGNSLVTGAFLAIATVAVGLLCFRRDIVLLPADYLFFALVLCILSSSGVQRVDQQRKRV